MKNDSETGRKTYREVAMIQLLRGGATLEQTIDIVKKLYIADGDKFNEKHIQEDVYSYHEIQLLDGTGIKKSIQNEVEDWITSDTSDRACHSMSHDSSLVCHSIEAIYSIIDCYRDLNYSTKEQKAACRQAFKRLVEKEKLIPLRNRSGQYKYINGKTDEIDFMNADTKPFYFTCPFHTHIHVNLYPKSIAILAGEPNSGKTAYLLNLAKRNMKDFNVHYFSSEMEATELKIRLEKFNRPLEEWKKVKFKFRTETFDEVIDPNGFNIIDYLQVHKDFYEISGLIHNIHAKLNKGVAFIALQKPKGRDEAVGGSRTLDLARLYLSIAPGVMKIVKAKIWADPNFNPNGRSRKFLLGGGANFKFSGNNGEKYEWEKD
jgi:hypothetical protein